MQHVMPLPIGPMRLTPGVWGQSHQGRGIAKEAPFIRESPDEKKQLIHRLPPEFVRSILRDFNSGAIDAASAAARLDVSRTRLYVLRTAWLKSQSDCQPIASGGNHGEAWPAEIIGFLTSFLPLQVPPSFQLVADEMERLHGFKRARSTVEDYVKNHLAHLIPQPERKPRTYRRFRHAHVGELWQHDSSIHQWRSAPNKQTLLLTTDDCSGLCVAGRFVESDTTWNHFEHFREAFEKHGLPQVIYTDGLSLFGPSSSHDRSDPKSEFQRALRPLHVAHIVAPTPQNVEHPMFRSGKTGPTLCFEFQISNFGFSDSLSPLGPLISSCRWPQRHQSPAHACRCCL